MPERASEAERRAIVRDGIGVGVGVVAQRLRVPFLIVVALAALTTALLRATT